MKMLAYTENIYTVEAAQIYRRVFHDNNAWTVYLRFR